MNDRTDLSQTCLWQEDLVLLRTAARQAGEIALGFFGQSPEVWWKNGGASPVSAADYAANEVLETVLRTARPSYGWLSEETEDDERRLKSDTLFVIDPIDGTRGFIAGETSWCVSAAVVHRGAPVAGVLFAPALNEEFRATVSTPAYLNNEAIAVRQTLASGPLEIAAALDMIAKLRQPFRQRIRRMPHIPSLAYRLAMVAAGRLDATLVTKNSHDWDLAAADIILQRSGGQILDLNGQKLVYNRPEVTHGFLCGGGALVHELVDNLIA